LPQKKSLVYLFQERREEEAHKSLREERGGREMGDATFFIRKKKEGV